MRFRSAALLGPRRHASPPRRAARPTLRRHPGRASTARRLATGKDFDDGPAPRRGDVVAARRGRRPAAWPTRLDGPAVRRALGRAPSPTRRTPCRAVHDLDAPAGGRPQAALLGSADHARRPSASTRTATSPTCGPTRTTLSDTALDRGPGPDRRAVRRRTTCPTRPAPYTSKVKNAQEAHEAIRPAGDALPHPRGGRAASCSGDEFRLYELIWKRTIASQMTDARGETRAGPPRARRPPTGATAEFAGHRARTITFPGFLRAYVEGADDPEARRSTTRSGSCPPLAEGDPLTADAARAQGPRDPAARPLHRGLAGQAARGARRRAPVHLRLDHLDHPGPRLRVEEGLGAGARPSPPSPWSRCSRSTSPTWSTTPSPPAWRTTSTPSPRAPQSRCPWLSRFYFGDDGRRARRRRSG